MVGGTAEEIELEKNGEKFVMSPILSTALTEKAVVNARAYANNGAEYTIAKVNDFTPEAIKNVFVPRSSQGTPTMARKIDLDKSMKEALNRRRVAPISSASNIQKTAYQKKKGGQ